MLLHIPSSSPAPGAKVPVGTLLAYVLAPGESPPSSGVATGLDAEGRPEARGGQPARRALTVAEPRPSPASVGPAPGERELAAPAISPRARRIAAELDVAWRGLSGSGRTGRIVERDVRAAAAARAAPPPAAATAAPGRAARWAGASQVRHLVAVRMAESARTVAAVTLTTEVDATELSRLRADRSSDRPSPDAGPVPTYNDLFTKLSAVALREHPVLNASLDGDRLVEHPHIHIGLAIDTDRGLVVGVQRHVERRSLGEIAEASAALVVRVRDGTASPDELRGGTFTITNLGAYDIDGFTPIVNLPECAILGIGRIVARPVVVDEAAGTIGVRKMVTLSLTFDHRVVDGAPAARFLQRVGQLVERPYLWLGR